jgi:hypothetical protein
MSSHYQELTPFRRLPRRRTDYVAVEIEELRKQVTVHEVSNNELAQFEMKLANQTERNARSVRLVTSVTRKLHVQVS